MQEVPDVIMPFPGGVVRSGSKVGSNYKSMIASTNDAYCPTLRGKVNTALDPDIGAVVEIVIDGLTSDAVAKATRAGLAALIGIGAKGGVLRISAGNYGGKLGPAPFPSEGAAAMTALNFTLKSAPAVRLTLAQLTPERLKGLSERDIAGLNISTTRLPVTVGDAFRIGMGEAERIRINGSTDRLDDIGNGLTGGSIAVEGHAGGFAGCGMSGGTITIKGDAGPWLGGAMSGGRIEITGTAGERAGGALPGSVMGMRGGTHRHQRRRRRARLATVCGAG